jgi:tRNA-binding EMAP/Myf-like protein
MTEWNPQVVRVEKIEKHPGADSLSIATVLNNYPVICKLDQYKLGQLVSYLPVDSVVDLSKPEFSFLDKPRIKARRLRGIYSQGLLIDAPPSFNEGDSIIDHFNIKKFVYDEEVEDLMLLSDEEKRHYLFPKIDQKFAAKLRGRNAASPPKGWNAPYYDLDSIRKYGRLFQEDDVVICNEKCDGCLSEDTQIFTLEHGTLPICDIVKNKLDCRVASFNLETKEIEYCSVIGWSELDSNDDWYEIISDDGTKIKITGEHYVFMPQHNCYRQVKFLSDEDTILICD